MKTVTKTRKLEEYKKIRLRLKRTLKAAHSLADLLDDDDRINSLISDTEIEIDRITKKIQDLEFDVNRTADFDAGY